MMKKGKNRDNNSEHSEGGLGVQICGVLNGILLTKKIKEERKPREREKRGRAKEEGNDNPADVLFKSWDSAWGALNSEQETKNPEEQRKSQGGRDGRGWGSVKRGEE